VKDPSVSIVGPGRLGTALATHLHSAGYRVCELIPHHRVSPQIRRLAQALTASATTLRRAEFRGNLVWLCVPDSCIEATAAQLGSRQWNGKIVFHSSGVLTSDTLARLKKAGASVASVHPLMTFVQKTAPSLRGVWFAIEGDQLAVRVAKRAAKRLGGNPVTIRKQNKPAYHLFATLICPLLISLLATSEKAARLAGLSPAEARTRMLPIIRQTISNYRQFGPSASFTGPFARGDVETVCLQLKVLSRSPGIRAVYVALAEAALQNLPHLRDHEIRRVLRESLPN
jgi:predicted short-subunit dehydrogenase-like oxidoreductase (DUF2520 family)